MALRASRIPGSSVLASSVLASSVLASSVLASSVLAMFLVGLTGGVATGKSAVSSMFLDLGVPVIDADEIARRVVEPGKPAWRHIRDMFGQSVFKDDGQLDRDKLRTIVFEDDKQRLKLNGITHPQIRKEMGWEVVRLACAGHEFAVIDLPLLFETGAHVFMHKIVVVNCDEGVQLERLVRRDGMSEEGAKRMMATQMRLEKKVEMAQYVVDNNGELGETRKQLLEIHQHLGRSMFHWKVRFLFCFVSGCILGLFYIIANCI